jgi:hypothetical protein
MPLYPGIIPEQRRDGGRGELVIPPSGQPGPYYLRCQVKTDDTA